MKTLPIASLIYDFDKTLSPKDMQEYGFLPGLTIAPDDFWAECRDFAVENQMDSVLAYMYKMFEKAQGKMPLTREALGALGASVEFFPGVTDWFSRVNLYGSSLGIAVEHYIISSGLREIIEGSLIGGAFKAVFAASFCYDRSGRAVWPSTAINYTSKTQHMFRINKGILDITNHTDLNNFTPKSKRRVPFPNMVYIGDGLTDVPCMKLVRAKGGTAIAVHPPDDHALCDDMLLQSRADFSVEADYRQGGEMERVVCALLRKIAASDECARLHAEHVNGARARVAERTPKPNPGDFFDS